MFERSSATAQRGLKFAWPRGTWAKLSVSRDAPSAPCVHWFTRPVSSNTGGSCSTWWNSAGGTACVAMNDTDDLIAVAQIVKVRGLRGEVVADLLTDFPERFEKLDHVTGIGPDEVQRSLQIEEYWFH